MIGAPMKRGNLETDTHAGRTPREDAGRDQSDAADAMKHQRLPGNHQRPRVMEQILPHIPPEGANPADTLTLDC